MPRISTKENKNIYQTTREELVLSREAASELMETISPERLVRIEGDSYLPHPEEVLEMAKGYKKPALCNYFCSQQCPIGRQYVPEIKINDLSRIVLGMLSSLNSMQREKDRLIDISADGMIDNARFHTDTKRVGKNVCCGGNAPALGGANDGRRQNRYETV